MNNERQPLNNNRVAGQSNRYAGGAAGRQETRQGGQYYRQPGYNAQTASGGNQPHSRRTAPKNGAQGTGARQNNTQTNRNSSNRTASSRINPQPKRQQNSQTAARTNSPQQTQNIRKQKQKVKLTPEQIKLNRINRERERYRLKKLRKERFRMFLTRFSLFLLLFAFLGAVTVLLFIQHLTKVDTSGISGYSYKIGDSREYSLSYSDAVRDGCLYVNFTGIANMCDLAVTGTKDDVRYIIKTDNEETVRFEVGTRTVYVNGTETRLSGESFYSGDDLFVPLDFVSTYFEGLSVSTDEKNHKVTITRDAMNLTDENGAIAKGEALIYEQLAFLLKAPDTLDTVDYETVKPLVKSPELGFTNDLSAYEEYMNPGNSDEYIRLINAANPLPSDYTPQDLVGVANTRKDGRATQQLRLAAAKSLEALFIEMSSAGFTDVTVTSGYRSYAYQESLFKQRIAMYPNLSYEEAYAKAATIVNPPGSSEHQSGLCLDMHNIATGADVSFGQTEQFKWLSENCWKFGFILRYPENKVKETGISYEPWHYRFVGRYHAKQIYESGLCLEEYVQRLNG